MVDKTLVGKEYGCQFIERTLKSWVAKNWDVSFNIPPKISLMSIGWFMLILLDQSQAMTILQKIWFMEYSPILMKLWNPTFDVASERIDSIPIWVQLSGLPLHLWNEKCFQAIANFLGEFLDAYMGFLEFGEI
jgi:hypothetical protein